MTRIYVPTYRRPEFVQRIWRSNKYRWPMTFVAPEDERTWHAPFLEDTLASEDYARKNEAEFLNFIWVKDDRGVGHARWLAGWDAQQRGLPQFAFADDDCVFKEKVDAIGLMFTALREYAHDDVAVVSRRTAWPLNRPWYDEERQVAFYNDKIGVCWAHDTAAYAMVGGIDRDLHRLEDHDLGLRLLLAGYFILEHRGAYVDHRSFQPGGCAAREGGSPDSEEDRKAKADISRRHHAALLQAKYPNLLKVDERGFVRRDRKEFERIQRAYIDGKCLITEKGIVWK